MLSGVFLGLLGGLLHAQMVEEGELRDRMRVGRHVWKDQNDQIKAEVQYDDAGVVLAFRTWDDKGLLMDDVRLDPKRKRTVFPPLDLTFEADGFGYLLIHGRAADNAPSARQGERVAVYYEGSLQDGTVFDGNYGEKKPLRFRFQMGEVVEGFDRAVSMLKVGEEGYFWLPSKLAYGEHVAGIIPPFSDLLFRIKLVDLN
jgi:FKBP-type peptidyl-prolyl cis-trans isomerase